VVYKYILSRVLDNEAEPFFIVEPLDFATCHSCSVPELRGRPKVKNDTTGMSCAATLLSRIGRASFL
jgi:hypothetical protein